MALKIGKKKQVCFACQFCAGIKISWSNTKTLNLRLSTAASKTTVGSASLDAAEDRQKKKRVCFACHFSAGIKILRSNTKTLNLKFSLAASKSTVGNASLDGAEDRQKSGVLCMPLFCRPLGIVHL